MKNKNCIQCKEQIAGRGVKFCSQRCMGNFNRGKTNLAFSQKKESHPFWSGGIKIDRGYRMVRLGKRKYRYEHRTIFEKILGRLLKKKETVHHWDEDRQNNDLKNLCLFRSASPHRRLHAFADRHGLNVSLFHFEQSWLK